MAVQQSGGIYRRNGLRYVGNVKNHDQGARLIPFRFSAADTYVLEFGHRYIRFIRQDAHVFRPTLSILEVSVDNIEHFVEITTSTDHHLQTGDDVYIDDILHGVPGYEGLHELNNRWYNIERKSSTRFRLRDQVAREDISGSGFSVYGSGGKVYPVVEVETPYDFEDLDEIKFAQSGDVITLVHADYAPRSLRRMDHDDWELTVDDLAPPVIPFPEGLYCEGVGLVLADDGGPTERGLKFQVTGVDVRGRESIPGLNGVGHNITAASVDDDNFVTATFGHARVALNSLDGEDLDVPSTYVSVFPNTAPSTTLDILIDYTAMAVVKGRPIGITNARAVYELDPENDFSGTSLRTLPSGVGGVRGAVGIGDDLYVIGTANEVWKFDIDGANTQGGKVRDLPTGLNSVAGAAPYRGGDILVFRISFDNRSIWRIDPEGADDEGEKLREVTLGTSSNDASAAGASIDYMFGYAYVAWESPGSNLDNVYRVDPNGEDDEGTQIFSLSTGGRPGGSTIYEGQLLVNNTSKNKLYLLDLRTRDAFVDLEAGDPVYIDGVEGLTDLNGRMWTISIATRNDLTGEVEVGFSEPLITDQTYSSGGTVYPMFAALGFDAISAAKGVKVTSNYAPGGLVSYRVYVRYTPSTQYQFFKEVPADDLDVTFGATEGTLTNAEILPPIMVSDVFQNNNPSVVGYFQQRHVLGASTKEPDKLYYSKIGEFKDFVSLDLTVADDDPIAATLAAGEVNRIQHLVTLGELLALTDVAQWQIRAVSGQPFAARTLRQRDQARIGASYIRPEILDDSLLYVREGQQEVVGLGYSNEREGYVPVDLSLLSRHLFSGNPIVSATALRVPYKQFVCVMQDGRVANLTFNPEQQVTAWTQWTTDGLFENVVGSRPNVDGSVNDAAYFVVRREVNGNTVRYIERSTDRDFGSVEDCFFLDSGLTYDKPVAVSAVTTGANTTITTETDHGLAAEDEVILSDILWTTQYDEFFTEQPVDQLNGYSYRAVSYTHLRATRPY